MLDTPTGRPGGKLDEKDIARIADELAEARKTGRKVAVPAGPEPSLSEAYRIQDAISKKLGGAGGWKVSPARPDFPAFGIYGFAVASPMLGKEVYDVKDAALTVNEPLSSADERVGIEVEIAYRIGRDLPASAHAPSEEEVVESISSAHIGMEICGARWSDAKVPFLWRLADLNNNRGFVVGEAIPNWHDIDFAALSARLVRNGETVLEKVGGHKTKNPLSLVVWQVQHCVVARGGIKAGSVITTGQLCGNHWGDGQSTVRGELPSLGLSVEWKLTSTVNA